MSDRNKEQEMAGEKVLFLDVARFEDGKVLRGGALVTDATTEPLEFRCTTPVRPTMLQKILWGARLPEHIAASLLGEPLIRSLQQEYSLAVVRDGDFLQLRDSMNLPIIRLAKHGAIDFDLPADSGKDEDRGKSEEDVLGGQDTSGEPASILDSASGRFEPVVLLCHRDHPEDMQQARQILRPMFQTRDVLEPFDRLQTALAAVHEEEKQKEAR